jgi:hypothetical protein
MLHPLEQGPGKPIRQEGAELYPNLPEEDFFLYLPPDPWQRCSVTHPTLPSEIIGQLAAIGRCERGGKERP